MSLVVMFIKFFLNCFDIIVHLKLRRGLTMAVQKTSLLTLYKGCWLPWWGRGSQEGDWLVCGWSRL